MNKLFTKIATAFVGMAMAVGVGVAVGVNNAKGVSAADVTATWTASAQGFSDQQQLAGNTYSFDDSNVTVSFSEATGNGHKYYNNGTAVRSYGGNTFTISCSAGNLTSITLSNNQSKEVTADVGTYSSNSWTGNSAAVTFTVASGSGNFRTSTLTAVYSGGGPVVSYTITYNANGGSGEMSDTTNTVAACTFTAPEGKEFSEWNTVADGSGDSYAAGDSVSSDVDLFAIWVTVTRKNPIQVLYTKASGDSVDVYGYYVGFLDGTGPVIMDGEYGIVIYNSSADVSDYTEKETILHVAGKISIYKGLYEIGSSTISVASGTYDAPDTPVVYATAGGETADYASRLTTVTGKPSVTKGSFDSDAGTADITMNFTVGTKTVQVFYKKAAQTADADAFAAIKAAVTDSTEITIKGFTGWYNGFQVQMNGYIPPAEGYTAEVFAQDLLDQTDTVCKDYDDVTDNHDAIEAIWSNLASNDKYPSLPSAEKTILAEAARDESGTVVEQAMARYDYLTGKYNLSNFINGRTPVAFEAHITPIASEANTTNAMIIVAVIALTSVSAIAVLLVIKRRKTY